MPLAAGAQQLAPRLGEHTDLILRGVLHYAPKAIDTLRAAGVFGPSPVVNDERS